jgi:hypothetical protein
MNNKSTSAFLQTGQMPSSHRERSAILDDLRAQILQTKNITNQTTNMQIFNKTMLNNMTPAERAAEQSKRTTHVQIAKQQLADVRATHAADFAEAARLKGQLAISAAKAGKTPAPIHRAATTIATAKPTPQATPIKMMTAADFQSRQPTMLRSEWDKLSNMDKGRFMTEMKGKLIPDPEPAKPHSKGGQLTREGLRALSPQAQNAYFAKGNRLAE